MAHSNLTPQDFIRNAFAPQIAVLCSEDADNLCIKNNLKFVELLQPFSKLSSEARISEPLGNNVPIRNFQVNFEEMNTRPPQPALGKKILSEAVASSSWDQEINKSVSSWTGGSNLEITLQPTTKWFEDWRDIFLQIQYPSDHEFTKHYIACIIVVSAGNDGAMEQINKLSHSQHQLQHQNTNRFPKWFSPNILKYYLILHDIQEIPSEKADRLFEQLSSAYGTSNCHLLRINSRPTSQNDVVIPDLWRKIVKQRRIVNGSNLNASVSSETSSGTDTPREDIVGLPSRVTEGDALDSPEPLDHPLSPLSSPVEEKNELIDNLAVDPSLLNIQPFPNSISLTHQVFGECLTSSDLDRINAFVEEFCIRTLIPHVERQIRYLNDVLINRSRSKSLLSATRRWLGGTKPPTNSTNSVIYSQEATELQTRRLGDLCFMFGLYDLAYNSYYTAKNDFKSDQAWLYFAGAQEMASLSFFMQNNTDYQKRYLEGSLHTYLNVCKVYNFAIRSTLMSSEILKHSGEFGEAAMIFIKMTSEESDLLSALMLEQAAHCFLNSKHPLIRKYAFHMTLAGHRFSKAGQRAHSLRAYKQAFQVYFDRGWILAEDHIHYTMGKQAFLMKLNKESFWATKRLVDRDLKISVGTKQNPTQQLVYMREFLNILSKSLAEDTNCFTDPVSIPIPVLNGQETKILIGDSLEKPTNSKWSAASHISFNDEENREKRWYALEREILTVIQGQIMIFQPNILRLTRYTANAVSSTVPLHEKISLELYLMNPLLVSLTISDIKPIYEFYDESDKLMKDDTCLICESVSGFNMVPESKYVVNLCFKPQKLGKIKIKGISYQISLTPDSKSVSDESPRTVSVEIQQEIEIKGPRLNNTLNEKCNVVYGKDQRLNIKIIPSMPKLSISFYDLPSILSCGEIKKLDLKFVNSGSTPLTNVYVSVSDPKSLFITLDNNSGSDFLSTKSSYLDGNKYFKGVNRVQKICFPQGNVLGPGEEVLETLWIHAPLTPGTFDVELLFYYESTDSIHKNRYRLIRHFSSIYLYPSISMKIESYQSSSLIPASSQESLTTARHCANLGFHIKNKCEFDSSGEKIELIGVGLNSSYYNLVPYHLANIKSLEVSESCQFSLRCAHVGEKSENKFLMSYIPIEEEQVVPSSWWVFSIRERLKLPELSCDSPPMNPLSNYEPPPPTRDQIIGQKLKDALSLDLIATVVWKSQRGSEVIFGQHSVFIDEFGKSLKPDDGTGSTAVQESPPIKFVNKEENVIGANSDFPPISKLTSLVKVQLDLPQEVVHNFRIDPLCKLHFGVTFYNSTTCIHHVTVDFSSKTSSSSASETERHSEASPNLLPVGITFRRFTLQSFQSTTLKCYSIVSVPGTYSLGPMSIKIKRESGTEWVQQVCHTPNVVLVKEEIPFASQGF